MTVNVNTQKALGGNNPILLKGTANNGIAGWFEGPTSAVKFSDYYRKTSTDLTKANFQSNNNSDFVPDATENATVPTSGAISFSDFRGDGDNGVIKEYVITQSGTDFKLDLDGQSWNSNLNKNVPKVANINGRLHSNSAPDTQDGNGYDHKAGAALAFDAEAYNLDITIDTDIGNVPAGSSGHSNATGVFGMGGAGGDPTNSPSGKRGGTAMFVQQNSNSSNAVTNGSGVINVNTNSGRLFAGGGGGEAGRSGTAGNTAACRFFTTQNGDTVTNSGFTIRGYNSCNNDPKAHCNAIIKFGVIGVANVMAGGGWGGTSCNGSGGRSRCRGGGRYRGDAGNMGCYNTITKRCKYRHLFAGNTGNAGNGGSGGQGESGYNDPGPGNAGNSGAAATCNDPTGGNITIDTIGTPNPGNDGTSGQPGGNFGSAGTSTNERSGAGGQAGFALFTNTKSQVKLSNTNNNRGVVNANVI